MLSMREFYLKPSAAAKLADERPVVLTNRDRPAYVLMRHDAYERLTKAQPSLVDLLAWPGEDDGKDFEPERLRGGIRTVTFD